MSVQSEVPTPEQLAIARKNDPSANGILFNHYDDLTRRLQHIAQKKSVRPGFHRSSDSDSSRNSIQSEDLTPDLTSSICSPSSESGSSVATPGNARPARDSYFTSNARHSQKDARSNIVINTKRTEWTGDSAYVSDNSSGADSGAASIHSAEQDGSSVPSLPAMPEMAKISNPRSNFLPEEPVPSISRPRPASISTPERSEPSATAALRTAQSTSDLAAADSQDVATVSRNWFTKMFRPKDLVVPSGPSAVQAESRPQPDIDIEDLEAGAQVRVAEPDSSSSVDSKASIWSRTMSAYKLNYAPTEAPPLIMPTAPTDAEKTLYLSTNRLGLYTFGVFSFLSLSVGMWLFVISSPAFYWFGGLVFLLQLYLIISYTVSICGKDYDYEKHLRILAENPIDENAPTVDVYLPCCKEPIEILENTYKHIQELKYPDGKLKVWVLDDGADDAVEALAAKYSFNYIRRDDRPRLKKAGNLRWAFARTEGDFFAIFDADFCPRPDFLYEIIPVHLGRPDTAIVQTPQFFRTLDSQSWVEQGAGSVQELFYRVVQTNRNRFGASICVGSNAVYRREALVETGGTAEIGFSEDVHTGFYALTRGWKVRYLPLCLACGICPDTPRAFFSQQMRWCMGSTHLLTNMDFWRSSLAPIQKICYLSGMMYYSAISLSIFINPLPGILMLWIRPDYVRYYNLAFAIPSVLYSLIALRCWAKASYGFNVQYIMVIQSYAYLMAIKDRVLGQALAWVPSGDTKAHKNNKYRNMRLLAIGWCFTVMSLVISGTIYQCLRGLPFYDCVPLIILNCFNLILSHRFMLWNGKI